MAWTLTPRYTNRNLMNIEQWLAGFEELEPQAQLERLQEIVSELEKLVNQ